ncbi:asparaginase [Luteipulveratus sp. YIM 133132]|uniref:asparaginase n=1 Tax=Luteipulveratus flavus TaxID=3031728 RepID=UPI0023B1D568|nr:asparaginase [Luteipulveratus sp. YIM 133132]MDE9366623.1 asparaginase [Luteipulveratus sp. YIM 133132]
MTVHTAGVVTPTDLGAYAIDGLPQVAYFALGGTIASVPPAPGEPAQPGLSAAQIAGSIGGLDRVAQIDGVDLMKVSSARLTLEHVLQLRDAATAAVDDGATGVVVSQGTDSLEETAYALDVVWDRAEPVVLTGAMRNPSLLSPDGAANLMAAVRTAASPQARDQGALVVLNDEVHAARYVRKTHTSSVATFQSPAVGRLGWVVEDRVEVALRVPRTPPLTVPADVTIPPVALVTMALGDDGRLLSGLPDLGYEGVVLAAMGGGHVAVEWVEPLRALAARMPVVLASRSGAGEVLSATYGYPGSEVALLRAGLLRAGGLDPLKARIRLQLALAAGVPVTEAFATTGTSSGPVTTPTR